MGSSTGQPDSGEAPVAVYLPVEGLDIAPGVAVLQDNGFRVVQLTSPQLAPDTPRDAVALLAGYDPVTAELIDQLPDLRIVATHSAGYDMVDLEAARARGIWVCNLPDGASGEVATHALALTLACLRQLPEWNRRARRGEWIEDQSLPLRRLSELTCGVVGLGRIGSRYAAMARAVFGRVLGVDPYLSPDAWPEGVEPADHDTIFATCHVVSLHVPLTEETEFMASAQRIASMPRGGVLVNVSRGALVDEPALVSALDSGHLAGAGLDVLTQEPPAADNPLLQHDLAIVTPHVGYLSTEAAVEYALKPAANVVRLWQHGRPHTPVVEPTVTA
jgi:phosphoglycerate dehydrogenase-like enzyme